MSRSWFAAALSRAAARGRQLVSTVAIAALVAAVAATPLVLHARQRSAAQDDRRREVTLTVTDAGFQPARLDARLNDIVAITLTAGDTTPHGLAIDAYRVAKRVEPGKPIHFEFRADTTGTFPFYCSLTGPDGRVHDERGELVVRR